MRRWLAGGFRVRLRRALLAGSRGPLRSTVLLGAHYASAEWQTTTAFFYRSAELVFAAHLLVAFLPYVGRGRAAGFWAYNESLFTRAVTAVVFSAVLFVGLAVG